MLIQEKMSSQALQSSSPLPPLSAARYTQTTEQASSLTPASGSSNCLSKLFNFLTWPVRKIWDFLCGLCGRRQENPQKSPENTPPVDIKKLFLTEPQKAAETLLKSTSADAFFATYAGLVKGFPGTTKLSAAEVENSEKTQTFLKDGITKSLCANKKFKSTELAGELKEEFKLLNRMDTPTGFKEATKDFKHSHIVNFFALQIK